MIKRELMARRNLPNVAINIQSDNNVEQNAVENQKDTRENSISTKNNRNGEEKKARSSDDPDDPFFGSSIRFFDGLAIIWMDDPIFRIIIRGHPKSLDFPFPFFLDLLARSGVLLLSA